MIGVKPETSFCFEATGVIQYWIWPQRPKDPNREAYRCGDAARGAAEMECDRDGGETERGEVHGG
jgi:hypothetical protein